MSNWSEAVWVVTQLQKNFDFSSEITIYTNKLDSTNHQILNLNDKVISLENNLEETQIDLINRVSSFIATKTSSGQPDLDEETESEITYSKGTIWFVQK